MMKDIRIDGRLQRVFVLKETTERIVYIPLKTLHRVDYEALKEVSEKYGNEMMEGLKKTKLPNGRNALAQYDSIIQVSVKKGDDTNRLRKPEEALVEVEIKKVVEEASQAVQNPVANPTPATAPKKRGPKPKSQQTA